jgi:integrase/recombinase XerD
MNKDTLLAIMEQHLTLTRPVARTHRDDVIRDRAKFGYRKNLLRSFVHFWAAQKRPWPIPSALALDWVCEGSKPGRPYRDRHRMFAVSGFLKHLRTIEPATEVPRNVFRKPARRPPRLLSDQEVGGLMKATAQLRACPIFRRLTLTTLLGVLASTGLRIGEALRLKKDDVHLDADPPHLAIYETKFGKSRIVVLHPTVAGRLQAYAEQRTSALSNQSAEAFFTDHAGKPLSYNGTRVTFLRLLRHAGITSAGDARAVTLHSLRHGFAVKRLTLWHHAGENVSELLPHLTVYLGHLDPKDTYWYLTATRELLETASERFELQQRQGAVQS